MLTIPFFPLLTFTLLFHVVLFLQVVSSVSILAVSFSPLPRASPSNYSYFAREAYLVL